MAQIIGQQQERRSVQSMQLRSAYARQRLPLADAQADVRVLRNLSPSA